VGPDALGRALEALYARVPLGMRLGLDAMRASCARLGHPERAFGVVHVAGTNGKGSTAAMVESMARAAGLRTGLYTSPHLCRFAERIRIGGEPIDDAALASLLERALGERDLSFFETATLTALLAFRDRGVDLAVVEVGIGGRLDATNVVPRPRCAAVTRIAFDHVDRLGETLEAIAREKAGIAKAGAPLVLGPLAPSVRAAAQEVAQAAGARIVDVTDADRASIAPLSLGIAGAHPRENAATAWRIADEIGLAPAAREDGLAKVTWPGRLERVAGAWLLDGAHNPDGARALVTSVPSAGALVFGALADKAWGEMLDVLRAIECPRFFVAPRGRAAVDPALLAKRRGGTPCGSVDEALAGARRAAGARDVLVCGSLYLVGEARARLLGLPLDPPVSL
jgi:dihydrofolate synthase/folylpolyglutamate synthase